MIDKISKILALAERAATPAEAEACFAKAQALATAHSISLAEARMNTLDQERRETPMHKTITIGEPRKRANKHLVNLMAAIAGVNDVKINIAHNSTYVIVFGFPSDINICEELWTRISHQMVLFAERYLAEDAWRGDSASGSWNPWTGAPKPVAKQTARSSYYSGFIASLSRRLTAARETELANAERRHENLHDADPSADVAATAAATTTALAIKAKSQEVDAYYQSESQARGTWRGNQRGTLHSAPATEAGRRDGHRVRITDSDQLAGQPLALHR